MNKEFVPHEQALELKELGFDEECAAHYLDVDDLELKWKIYRNLSINTNNCLQAPVYQQAFRWFRKKYNYNHSIVFTKHPFGTDEYQYMILLEDDECVEINFKTYEEAELECLKKLIEIVKTK
jgi:hypothetical protein